MNEPVYKWGDTVYVQDRHTKKWLECRVARVDRPVISKDPMSEQAENYYTLHVVGEGRTTYRHESEIQGTALFE